METDSIMEIWTVFTTEDFVNDNAHRITSENWPFKYKSKAGDCFDDFLSKIIENHNEKLWEHIMNIGFKKPEKLYYEQYNNERKRIEYACYPIYGKN